MAKKAKQLITTIGQLMDAIVKDRATIVSVPGGQLSHLDATIRRCWRHYGAVPKDGALLRGIDAVAEHRGCLAYLVRRMTLEEFNDALDEAFEAKGTMPVYLGNSVIAAGDRRICLEAAETEVLEAVLDAGAATLSELRRLGISNPNRVFNRMKDKYKELANHIHPAESRGRGGYSVTIRDGRPHG